MLRHSAARVVLFLAPLLYLVCFVLDASKNPLRADEVDYFECIRNTREHGEVLYYAGEVDYSPADLVRVGAAALGSQSLDVVEFSPRLGVKKGNRFGLAGTSRYTYCLWHPPLYIEASALFERLLTPSRASAWQLRLLNLPWVLLLGVVLFRLSQKLYPDASRPTFLLALSLLATSPFWLQGSSLVDYNATLAPAAAALLALGYIEGRERVSAWTVAAFALSWFTSMGLGVAMTAGVLAASALALDRRAFARMLLQASLGFALFSAIFYLWARARGFSFAEPYVYNFLAGGGAERKLHLGRSLRVVGRYAVEMGLAPSLLFVALAVVRYRRESIRTDPAAVLVLAVVAGLGMHAAIRAEAWGVQKYVVFVLPLLLLFVAGELATALSLPPGRGLYLAWGALSAVGVEAALRLGAMVASPSPTLYLAGQRGLSEVASEVRRRTSPEEVVVAPKDVAFYAERRFIDPHQLARLEGPALVSVLERHRVRVVVDYRTELASIPARSAPLLLARYPVSGVEGVFRLRRTDASP